MYETRSVKLCICFDFDFDCKYSISNIYEAWMVRVAMAAKTIKQGDSRQIAGLPGTA